MVENPLNSPPIIFIHYGFSPYLPYTLQIARKYNPGKEIYLLGDDKNKSLEKYGVKHVLFSDYEQSPEMALFDKVFKIVGPEGYRIGGKDNGASKDDSGYFWTKFVFRKMFLFYNFAKANNINRFWTFDSDNLILTDLAKLEPLFEAYDNTEQNKGNSMHGIINHLGTLKGYIDTINELFRDEEYLKKQSEYYKNSPKHFAFTEMAAYAEYKKRKPVKTFYLTNVLNNSIFDDKLVYPDGMEQAEYDKLLATIKRIYWGPEESFYFKQSGTGKFIKANSMDFSWKPAFVPEMIYKIATKQTIIKKETEYQEIAFKEPLKDKLLRAFHHYMPKAK